MKLAAAVLLLTSTAYGQSYYKHNFKVGAGAGIPRDQLTGLFDPKVATTVSYGYRFHPWFQLDAGFDTVYGAANVRDFVQTGLGDLRIRDFEFFLPFGGRVIVPLAKERIHLEAGGGYSYIRYTERLRQPFEFARFDCAVCSARDGWAGYGLLGANVALDQYRHFRLGVSTKVYRGNTEGEPIGAVPPVRTRDRWIAVFAEFTVSF